VGLRIEYTTGMVGAADSSQKNYAASSDGRYERNLSFRSPISEVALIAEFHPLYIFKNWANSDDPPPHFSPYLLAGVGHFHFNPQALYEGQWVDLQPLHTEGEGFKEYPNVKEYSLNQFNIPWGFGFRYELTSIINLRLEVIDRVLFTDYLDDVSTRYIDPSVFKEYLSGTQLQEALALYMRPRPSTTEPWVNPRPGNLSKGIIGSIRGDPNNNDNYFSVNLKVGIILGREKIN
jgi:hypothetical protein